MTSAFVVAFLLSALVGFPIRAALLRFGILDRPNARSSHAIPTARGGGLGFVGIMVAILLVGSAAEPVLLPLALATIVLAFVGFVDDLRSIGVLPRLACHLGVALVPAYAYASDHEPATLALAVVAFVGTVGLTNAFNFMDGIDGIAATHATVTFVATAVLAAVVHDRSEVVVAWFALAGAVAGFLPWNFPRARMFMGDVASAPLGYLLASAAVLVVRDGGLRMILPIALVHAGFVLDTAITFVRRLARRERVFDAHREHFYQRLVRSGNEHPPVTAAYSAITALASIGACAIPYRGALFAAIVSIAVLATWSTFFAYAEARFRRGASAPGAPR